MENKMEVMNALEFLYSLIMWSLFACGILLFLDPIIDQYMLRKHYQKKKPKNTGLHCPETGKELKDVDLFYMHCLSCPREKRSACNDKIREEMKIIFK